MKLYTRTGDAGETSLLSGGRVRKEDLRVEAYGTVDELGAVLGLLRSEDLPEGVDDHLVEIQSALFSIGAALADPEGRMEHEASAWNEKPLEGWIDSMDSLLDPLKSFILPGGCRSAAVSHVARTICRRAERRVGALESSQGGVKDGILRYLNRLSDSLFTLARFLNLSSGIPETEWHPGGSLVQSTIRGGDGGD
jgi:cob(I)alamin adenosyltransferase